MSTRAVDGVSLVVARLIVAVVRIDGSSLSCAQILYASGVASDGILAVSILIVAVGIIILDILQIFVVCKFVTSLEIILVEVISHLAIAEVVIRIAIIPVSIKTIDVWSAFGCLILEAAMVFTTIGIVFGYLTACQAEVIYLSLVVRDKRRFLRQSGYDMTITMYDTLKGRRCFVVIRQGDVFLHYELRLFSISWYGSINTTNLHLGHIIADSVDKLLESPDVLLVAEVYARFGKTIFCVGACQSLGEVEVDACHVRIHLMIVVYHETVVQWCGENIFKTIHADSELYLITVHEVISRYLEIVFSLIVITSAEESFALLVAYLIYIIICSRTIDKPRFGTVKVLTYAPIIAIGSKRLVGINLNLILLESYHLSWESTVHDSDASAYLRTLHIFYRQVDGVGVETLDITIQVA